MNGLIDGFIQDEEIVCKCSLLKGAYFKKQIAPWGNTSSKVLFLISHPYSSEYMEIFYEQLKNYSESYKYGQFTTENSAFLHAIGCSPLDGTVPDSDIKYIDCKDQNTKAKILEIKPKVIVTEGAALYTIVEETNLKYEAFYNYTVTSPYFYSEEFDCWVVPLPKITDWINVSEFNKKVHLLNNYPFQFTNVQLLTVNGLAETKKRKMSYNIEAVTDYSSFFDKFKDITVDKVAVDIETTGLDFFRHKIITVQLCFDGKLGYCLPWSDSDDFKNKLNDLLKRSPYQIYANGKFDCKFLVFNGITNAIIGHDVNYAGHFIYSNRGNSLKAQAFYYTDIGGYERELDRIIRKYSIKDYSNIADNILYKYAAIDVIVTHRIEACQQRVLNDAQKKLFYETYIPLANQFVEIELNGMHIDYDALITYRNECIARMKEISDELTAKFPNLVLTSETSIGEFFKEIGAESHGMTKARGQSSEGRFKTQEAILLKWKDEGVPYVDQVLEFKKLNKLVSTYLGEKTQVLDKIHKYRVHSSFNFQLNKVGRLASDSPNCQNYPIKSDNRFARLFTAPKGYLLAECDFSGFHLRLVAMMSGDKTMREMFTNPDLKKRDMHSMTAAAIFTDYSFEEFLDKMKNGSKEEKALLKDYRNSSKSINFGLLYGMAYKTLSSSILKQPVENGGWSVPKVDAFLKAARLDNLDDQCVILNIRKSHFSAEVLNSIKYDCCAREIHSRFFKRYSGLEPWINSMRSFAKKNGYVDTMYGFRLWMPEFKYQYTEEREIEISNLRNGAVNWPVIGTEANIMQRSQLLIDKYFKENGFDAKIVNQIHDSLVIELKEDLKDVIKDKIKEIMTRDYPEYNGIPLDAEAFIGPSWGEKTLWFE